MAKVVRFVNRNNALRRCFLRQVKDDRAEGYLPDNPAGKQMAKDFAADFPDEAPPQEQTPNSRTAH